MILENNQKIAFIDLTNKTWRSENTSNYSDFIGGRGINQKILFSRMELDINPLDPESVIILGVGALVGTLVPTACRLSVEFKNVLTGGVGSGNVGGHFAAEMRFAGFDHLVITGRSEYPCYIFLENGSIYFRDAINIWGKSTWDTEIEIQKLEKNLKIRTLSIGKGGENCVKFACLISDRGRAAAYGGSGAIFGSKNLKAVAAHGTKDLLVAQPDELLKEVRKYIFNVLNRSDYCKEYNTGGTLLYYLRAGEKRPHIVRNMADEFWSQKEIDKVSLQTIGKYRINDRSCFNCPLHGTGIFHCNNIRGEGVQANTWRAFASNLTITDPEKVLELHAKTNLAGLDNDHTSSILAWTVECYKNGIINKKDTDGIDLDWGNGKTLIQLLDNIINRRGFGDILARGLQEAAKFVGRDSEKLASISHGNAVMESGMRTHRAWALGIFTSTKGGGHLRGAPCVEFKEIEKQNYQEIYEIPEISEAFGYTGKAPLVVWYERYKALVDIMGICYLPTMWMETTLFTPDDISRFYNLVAGENISSQELLILGEKVQVIEALFNMLHAGFGRRDCMPPKRITDVPISDGIFKGKKLDFKEYIKMLDEYYKIRDWDPITGWPTSQQIKNLGLHEQLKKIEDNGLLLPR